MFNTFTTKLATVIPAAAVVAAVGAASVLGAGTAAAATVDTSPAPQAVLSSSQGSSGMTLHVVNNSNETMKVISASNPYGSWQDRAVDIPAHTAANVSDYSSNINGADISLTYQMPDGTMIHMQGLVPLVGKNSVSAYTNTTHFTAKSFYDSGYHPTFEVDIADA